MQNDNQTAAATRQESPATLTAQELADLDAWWRACNYLAVGMIYLQANPLLKQPLRPEHIKPRLLGHWGTDPGMTLMYVHLNRLIRMYDLNMIFIAGPGHGAPAILAPAYLEGTYSEIYPDISEDEEGMRKFFRQFSFPGGIGSHATPETPGSIHEGGELGYSLSHAHGAVFDNPDLIAAVAIGDGEAETGPLAASWHSSKFLNPIRDGAVLPILHLNGFKIANPTILSRVDHDELDMLLRGYGWIPRYVEGDDPQRVHAAFAAALEDCVSAIRAIQKEARTSGVARRARWPMIVLRTPKGWTCPKEIDHHQVEGTWRAHQVPLAEVTTNPEHLALLEQWMKSYKPEALFDANGRLIESLRALAPQGLRRMSANPVANGGLLRRPLQLPDIRQYAVEVPKPGQVTAENTKPLGTLLRDVMRMNPDNFRVFGPDETASNRLQKIYEATSKTWLEPTVPTDKDGGFLAPDGRVMEILSEHTLEGWLEGYLLTGRHGLFSTYEAFAHVIDSMFNQHAKWLDVSRREVPWRAPVSSLNILLSSTVWRQDHNGFSHQDPGFLDLVTNKSSEVTRIYLPPDANCLLAVAEKFLRSTNRVNVIVADKQSHLQYLTMEEAIRHCAKGIGIWEWACTHRTTYENEPQDPDVVLACCGDVPTLEALAAVDILRHEFPSLAVRFINVVNLFKLIPDSEHPHGLSDRDFDSLFTEDKPVIFNFHGYPWLIHKLVYRRSNQERIHVRGYKEQGSINTPLELAMINQIDRFNLVIDVIDRVPALRSAAAGVKERMRNAIIDHMAHAHQHGIDQEEVRNWTWH